MVTHINTIRSEWSHVGRQFEETLNFTHKIGATDGKHIRIECPPVDTGRKLNLHKTFRRRPGRLLNVLCRFNLRPVPIGPKCSGSLDNNYRGSNSFVLLAVCNVYYCFRLFDKGQ